MNNIIKEISISEGHDQLPILMNITLCLEVEMNKTERREL